MKRFNTAGVCLPSEHYMVDISERLAVITQMIAQGDYFCINRGRQYGKTTTLRGLKRHLEERGYSVFYISLEGMGDYYFASEERLGAAFLSTLCWSLQYRLVRHTDENAVAELMRSKERFEESCPLMLLRQTLQTYITKSAAPVVLLIDEVDQASNHLPFVELLGMLRDMFLQREDIRSFQSVVLAGVYDIKNLKLRIRSEEQRQYNSPWNIAVPFEVDLALSTEGIANMLAEYKADHNLDFDCKAVAALISDYTAGYPYLVSRICQIIDAEALPWKAAGVQGAVNKILGEGCMLFDDIVKKLDEFPELERTIRGVLFEGMQYSFNYYDKATNLGLMFNFVKQEQGTLSIACRLFETWFYNYFISQEKTSAAC